MALSTKAVKQMMTALADAGLGNEVATAINKNTAAIGQSGWTVATVIVGTNVSQTIDFGALVVGDQVAMIPAIAGNSIFYTCATAGTLPVAGVVGNLYVVLRAFTAPAATAVKF